MGRFQSPAKHFESLSTLKQYFEFKTVKETPVPEQFALRAALNPVTPLPTPQSAGKRQPFARVRLDASGHVVSCQGSGEEFALMRPFLVLGNNLFERADLCPGLKACHRAFRYGVQHGFLNSVLECTFTQLETPMQVKAHMMTVPDAGGKKDVVLFLTRLDWAVSGNAFKDTQANVTAEDLPHATESVHYAQESGSAASAQTTSLPAQVPQVRAAATTPATAHGTSATMNALVGAVLAKLQVAPAAHRSVYAGAETADALSGGSGNVSSAAQNNLATPPKHQDILRF